LERVEVALAEIVSEGFPRTMRMMADKESDEMTGEQ